MRQGLAGTTRKLQNEGAPSKDPNYVILNKSGHPKIPKYNR